MVIHFREYVNTYGSFAAFVLGFLVRFLGGEPYIGLPAAIHYPMYDVATGQQNFPFRTVAMLVSLVSLIVVSAIAKVIFTRGLLPARYDFCRCFDLGPKNKGESEELANGTLTRNGLMHPNKEDPSPLRAAELKLYKPKQTEDEQFNAQV